MARCKFIYHHRPAKSDNPYGRIQLNILIRAVGANQFGDYRHVRVRQLMSRTLIRAPRRRTRSGNQLKPIRINNTGGGHRRRKLGAVGFWGGGQRPRRREMYAWICGGAGRERKLKMADPRWRRVRSFWCLSRPLKVATYGNLRRQIKFLPAERCDKLESTHATVLLLKTGA